MFPTCDQFAAATGDAFAVTAGDDTWSLILTKVTPLQGALPDRESFRLTFAEAGQDVLQQAIYRFAHPALGDHDIFIVPAARDRDGVRYEAVFN